MRVIKLYMFNIYGLKLNWFWVEQRIFEWSKIWACELRIKWWCSTKPYYGVLRYIQRTAQVSDTTWEVTFYFEYQLIIH